MNDCLLSLGRSRLTTDEWTVFGMAAIAGMTLHEAATELGVSPLEDGGESS